MSKFENRYTNRLFGGRVSLDLRQENLDEFKNSNGEYTVLGKNFYGNVLRVFDVNRDFNEARTLSDFLAADNLRAIQNTCVNLKGDFAAFFVYDPSGECVYHGDSKKVIIN